MKKLIAMLMALVLVMGLAACGGDEGSTATTAPAGNNETTAATEGAKTNSAATATEMLNPIWQAIPEDNRFFVMGGDMNNMVDGAAGDYSLEDEGLATTLYVPADQTPNLLNASSLMHGMLANNFTCGMFQVSVEADVNAFAEAMKESIANAQWICGMPEKMIIAVIGGEYVLACFGINDAIAPFETALGTVYADANILYNEAIAG